MHILQEYNFIKGNNVEGPKDGNSQDCSSNNEEVGVLDECWDADWNNRM